MNTPLSERMEELTTRSEEMLGQHFHSGASWQQDDVNPLVHRALMAQLRVTEQS